MSHTMVGVICEVPEDVQMQMEPFRPYDDDDFGIEEFVKFDDLTNEVLDEYKEYMETRVGDDYSIIDFALDNGYDYRCDELGNMKYGYTYNEQCMYDYWTTDSENAMNALITKTGEVVNYAKIKDIDFEAMNANEHTSFSAWYAIVTIEGHWEDFDQPDFFKFVRDANPEDYIVMVDCHN